MCACVHACSWEWECTDEASGVSWNQRRDPRIVPNYRVPFRDTPVAWQLPTPITQPFLSHTHFFSLRAPLQVPETCLITFHKLNWRQNDSLWSVELIVAPSTKPFSVLQCSSNFFSESDFVIMEHRARDKVETSAATFLSENPVLSRSQTPFIKRSRGQCHFHSCRLHFSTNLNHRNCPSNNASEIGFC